MLGANGGDGYQQAMDSGSKSGKGGRDERIHPGHKGARGLWQTHKGTFDFEAIGVERTS